MNEFYSYDSIGLWARNAWDHKISPVNMLIRWIAAEGFGAAPPRTTPAGLEDHLPEGAVYDPKMKAVSLPETLRFWKEKGMHFRCDEAGGTRWIVLAAEDVAMDLEHDPETLYVMSMRDLSNPFWAMEALEEYRGYGEMMAEKKGMLIITCEDIPSRVDLAILILREIAQRYNVNYQRFYMDVSPILKAGRTLKEAPGFRYAGKDGVVMEDPDAAVFPYGSLQIPVLDIAGQWVSKDSLEFANFTPGRIRGLPFDYERLIHSQAGRMMADAMRLEYDYETGEDPGLQEHLRKMGLRYGYHEHQNRGWVALTPEYAFHTPDARVPCMIILQEIAKSDPRSIPSAFSLWYEYLNLAAQGEMMLLFWVLEDPISNDMLLDILKDAEKLYPFMDRERLYMTGHSHNGHYTLEFARRHPDLLAGIATMGNAQGIGFSGEAVKTGADRLQTLRDSGIPCINVNGQWENTFCTVDFPSDNWRYQKPEERVQTWQNRLEAFDCPTKSAEEILAAANSPDYATRMLGVPVDHSEVAYVLGDECWMGDVKSRDGSVRLRIATIKNMPHATSAHMPYLSWSFLKRFRRDANTRKIVNMQQK